MILADMILAAIAVLLAGISALMTYRTYRRRNRFVPVSPFNAENTVKFNGVLTQEAMDRLQAQMVAAMKRDLQIKRGPFW